MMDFATNLLSTDGFLIGVLLPFLFVLLVVVFVVSVVPFRGNILHIAPVGGICLFHFFSSRKLIAHSK